MKNKSGSLNPKKKYMLIGAGLVFLILAAYFLDLSGLGLGSLTALFIIDSSPQGASVTMDGKIIGTTPFSYYSITPLDGKVLTFNKDGYKTKTHTISIFDKSPVSEVLVQASTSYNVLVETYPVGVSVYDFNNNYLGMTPFSYGMAYGQITDVYFEKKGWTCPETTIQFNGKPVKILCRADATPAPTASQPTPTPTVPPTASTGFIDIKSTPSGASISIDGIYKGTTPKVVSMPKGDHMVKLSLTGYSDNSYSVYTEAGQTAEVQLTLMGAPQGTPKGTAGATASPTVTGTANIPDNTGGESGGTIDYDCKEGMILTENGCKYPTSGDDGGSGTPSEESILDDPRMGWVIVGALILSLVIMLAIPSKKGKGNNRKGK